MSALEGLRILDFSRVLAGPFATMMLGDLGATVIKVERPGQGDDTRAWGPPFDEAGIPTYFLSVNRNKESVTLDLSNADDLAKARAMAQQSDVVIENFRPGVMEKLGLDYNSLSRDHSELVYCSISGFGNGAGSDLPGYDLLVQAMGGLMSITGSAQGEPQKVGVALVDVLAGLFATVGILTAVMHSRETRQGQRVEIDLLSSLLAALVNQSASFTSAGVVPTRMGNQHPSIAPYELFKTASEDLVLAVGTDKQFASTCDVLGLSMLALDAEFATNTSRVANRVELRKHLEVALSTKPAAYWVDRLSSVGVPAGVVNDIAAAFKFAEGLGLNPIIKVVRDDGTEVLLPKNPIGLSLTPPSYRLAPPDLKNSESNRS
jgi:crotonobetainyl-CoA:carnitine CoA-transferase CaiB-like acyl-CoA transferase